METPTIPAATVDPAVAPPAAATPSQTLTRVLPQYETVAIDDEAAASRAEMDYYKGRKNVTDRIAVLDLKRIAAARSHFAEGLGSILCRSQFQRQSTPGPDNKVLYTDVMTIKAGCCEMLGESNKRFAAPVIQYQTNPKGDLVKPLAFTLKVWRFAIDRFGNLQAVNKEFSLATHDIKATCTDDQYQKITVVACAESVFAHPKFQEDHGAGIKNWLDVVAGELKRCIGRDMTDADLKKKLGELSPASAAVADVGTGSVSSLDDLLA